MATAKSIESLVWSDTSYTLREFLEKFSLPNLVRIREGYYGANEACTFDDDQILLFHALRYRQNLIGEDSAGRPIAIPLHCTNKFLVCPLSTYCRFDPIYVSQMSYVYPEIKYFRVLENNWNEAIKYLKPESILEVESIDPESYAVKFVNIEQALPTSCRVVFEPLLDFCEHTLKGVVGLFGLPAKVTALPDPNVPREDLENESENWVSNVGKISVVCSQKQQVIVVATKIDAASLDWNKSVTCLQIPTDVDLNILVAKGLVKNDPEYLTTVRELNRALLHNYDLNELDRNDQFDYLDRPDGNLTKIRDSVLLASEQADPPELLPRLRCYNMSAPVPPARPAPARSESEGEYCEMSEKAGTVKDIARKLENLGIYDDTKHCNDLEEKNFEYEQPNEGASDDSFDESSDDGYEQMDDFKYAGVDDANVTSLYHVSDAFDDYVDMSSDEECRAENPGNNNSAQGAKVKPAKTERTESKVPRKATLFSALKLKFRSKRSYSENLHETVDGDKKNYGKQSVSTDLSAPRMKSKSSDDLGNANMEFSTKKPAIPIPRPKPTINVSHSASPLGDPLAQTHPVCPIPKTQSVPPFPQPQTAPPCVRKTLSVSPTTNVQPVAPTLKPTSSTVKDQPVFPVRRALSASSVLSTQDKTGVLIPTDLTSLSVQGVGRVLASLNMACYVSTFEEEQIDGEMLMELDETGLQSLDVSPFHVVKLIKVISGWRPNFDNKIALESSAKH